MTQRLPGNSHTDSLITSLLELGRASDSTACFKDAIALGSNSARADFALLCLTANLPHEMCRNAFDFIKYGHDNGCPDCTGMLAFYYVTGCRGVTLRCDDTAYRLACQSAAAGSWFGKMALVHFLNSLLGIQDPDEEKFYVFWTDNFISNFAGQSIDVPALVSASAAKVSFQDVSGANKLELPNDIWGNILQNTSTSKDCENLYSALPMLSRMELKNVYDAHMENLSFFEDWFEPDQDILSNSDIRMIARILIDEIQQEHQRNPDMPTVWCNLPALGGNCRSPLTPPCLF